MPEPARRIEIFTGAGRRRNWSGEEKAAIVAESHAESETVCAVARRHGPTAQQLYTWRRRFEAFEARAQWKHRCSFRRSQTWAVKGFTGQRLSVAAPIELESDGVIVRSWPQSSAQ